MARILGIDTSNYTTSVAVVEDGKILYDNRKLLTVEMGERGLRQSEALFQHVINLPLLLDSPLVKGVNGVCASTRPRPVEGSYMPVFKAGEGMGRGIAKALGVPFFETSHQEGHLEAAVMSLDFEEKDFYALHMSGGTSELLRVRRGDKYEIEIIGGSKDISLGQFLDRIGVYMGYSFPSGKYLDLMATKAKDRGLRIPSRVDGLYFNLSGQETKGLKYIEDGYNHEEVALAAMNCVCKTLYKLFTNLNRGERLPIILMGGVASSIYLREYFRDMFTGQLFFSAEKYASDNAVGAAYIGDRRLRSI